MWRSKKFIIATSALVAVLLAGSIGAVALAADNEDKSQPGPRCRPPLPLEKVCEIYQQKTGVAIDCDVLKEAFAQVAAEMRLKARQDRLKMRTEAMQNRLQELVREGKITQEQAEAIKKWWESRPSILTQEQAEALKKWWEARPDVPLGFGPKNRGGFPCFPGKGWPCPPAK